MNFVIHPVYHQLFVHMNWNGSQNTHRDTDAFDVFIVVYKKILSHGKSIIFVSCKISIHFSPLLQDIKCGCKFSITSTTSGSQWKQRFRIRSKSNWCFWKSETASFPLEEKWGNIDYRSKVRLNSTVAVKVSAVSHGNSKWMWWLEMLCHRDNFKQFVKIFKGIWKKRKNTCLIKFLL